MSDTVTPGRDNLGTEPAWGEPVCEHCMYRSGDLCTHPGSPVNDGEERTVVFSECGPVCVGDVRCEVRQGSVAY